MNSPAHQHPYSKDDTAMPSDPYAVLRALLRAEAIRNTPKPKPQPQQQPPKQPEHG